MRPLVSIVVATKNRVARLPETLGRHERIETSLPWELVIVDNGSTDETSDLLLAFARRSRLRVRVLSEPVPAKSRALNVACGRAEGDLLAFMDDDCYPRADYIDQIARVFGASPRLAYLGGRILLHDPSDFPITIQTQETRQDIPPRAFIPAGLLQGANLAARREAFASAGGFDPMLGAGTPFPCEDIEFASRLSAKGLHGAYEPGPVVFHHHGRRTEGDASDLMRFYDRGRGAYYARCLLDPDRRRPAFGFWRRDILARVRDGLRGRSDSWRAVGHEAIGALHYLAARRSGGHA